MTGAVESDPFFEDLHRQLIEEYRPNGFHERDLVRKIALSTHALRAGERLEGKQQDRGHRPCSLFRRYREKHQRDLDNARRSIWSLRNAKAA
jgi:hypothetical protein